MKKFTFSLQGVLEAKSKIEEAARMELARLMAEKARIEATIDQLTHIRRTHDERLRQKAGSGLSVAWLRAAHQYAAELTQRIAHHTERAAQAQQKVETQRGQVIDCTKERRCFETLRQRRYATYHRDWLRAQYNNIDELLSTRRKETQHG